MGRIDRRLKTELGSLPSPEPRPAHVDETAALCLEAYRARRRMSRLGAPGGGAGAPPAYERVMAAVSDFEKGNMRLSVVLSSLEVK